MMISRRYAAPRGESFELMETLGMRAFLMTTGSRGLHVVAPLQADTGFDTVRELARGMAVWLAEASRR